MPNPVCPPVEDGWRWRRIANAIAAQPDADDATIAKRVRLARAHVAHVRARLATADRATSHDLPPALDPAVTAALDAAHPVGEPVTLAPPLAAELAPIADGYRAARRKGDPSSPAACCLRCRIELPSPKRLAHHVEAAHAGEAFPPVVALPEPAPGGFTPRTAPSVPAPAQFDALPTPEPAPEPAPAPTPIARVERRAGPTCGCLGPFERDLADPEGRCLRCSGAYARFVDRRLTSHRAAAAAAD